jgi:hypothetical protein
MVKEEGGGIWRLKKNALNAKIFISQSGVKE